ncbi:molybdopterin-dependent oxidoreductase [Marisediminicola sp. LYQ134]|uniref:molybdopterin-dependent oxidoreductase n=1 Tax=Marisediminicola sp. LYQ134 TaxID=3391061 RepID=UPI003983C8B0
MHRLLHDVRRSLASPSRNPRMATVLGRLLAIAFLVCFGTGLFSHYLQEPLPWMVFPTRPVWIYQVSQGLHITAGIVCFPLLLGKLYTVFPELFQSPPVRSVRHFFERASIAVFVAASIVEITIGLLNTFQLYAFFPFPFRQTHFALSFVVIGSLAIHIAIKLPTIAQYWRKRDSYEADGSVVRIAEAPQSGEHDGRDREVVLDSPHTTGVTGRVFAWIDRVPGTPREPRDARTSRRGFLAAIGLSAAALVVFTGGQSFRVLDGTNLFAPRKQGVGPNDLPVNRTARAADVLETAVDPGWTLTVSNGSTSRVLSRDELLALPQYDVELPIACVEGWSQSARWRGPRMRDLADLVGAEPGARFRATSLEEGSIYAVMEMGAEYVRDDLTLVALELNGSELDIDHGYPARMIAPARPGVLQTKWLSRLEVIS